MSTLDRRTPDERCTASFPAKLRELELGWRLDALDGQGTWFAATVVQVCLVVRTNLYSKYTTRSCLTLLAPGSSSILTVASHKHQSF